MKWIPAFLKGALLFHLGTFAAFAVGWGTAATLAVACSLLLTVCAYDMYTAVEGDFDG